MKKFLILIIAVSLSFLVGCEKEIVPETQNMNHKPSVEESLTETEVTKTPILIQDAENDKLIQTITMPEQSSRDIVEIKPEFFEWDSFVPMVRYFKDVFPTAEKNVPIYSYAILDNNFVSAFDGEELYNKFNNKYLVLSSMPDEINIGTLSNRDTDFNNWKSFFESSRIVYISENADTLYRFSYDYADYNGDNLMTNTCAGKTELIENEKVTDYYYEEKVSLLNYSTGKCGEKKNPVFDIDTKYTNSEGLMGTQAFDNAIILYSEAIRGYKKASVYTTDLELIAKLKLPYKLNSILNKVTCYITCEVAQVIDKSHLLLVFTEEKPKSNPAYSKNYAYLYDIDKREYSYLSSQVNDPAISPDLKYFIYSPRLAQKNSLGSKVQISVGDSFEVVNLENNTCTSLEVSNSSNLSVVNWINKSAFYNTIDESAPEIKAQIQILETESESINTITVEIPASKVKNEFTFEEGVAPKDFDFGGYMPYLKKTSTSQPHGIIVEDFALFNNETDSIEKAEALYKKFNETFINEPVYVDGSGNELNEFPFLKGKVCAISPDCHRVVAYKNTASYEAALAPLVGYGSGVYYFYNRIPSLYINGKLARPKVTYNYNDPSEMLFFSFEEKDLFDNKAYKINNQFFYSPTKNFTRSENVLVYKRDIIYVYSTETHNLVKKFDFSLDIKADYDAVKVGQEMLGQMEIGNPVKEYLPIIVERNIKHPEGDCTCGMRGHQNKILYLYNVETEELKLLASNFIEYSFSPDMKYVAYTYNTVENEVEKTDNDTNYYEIFEGGIFIKNIESGEFVSYPYKVVNNSSDDTPTAAWQPIGWVNTSDFNKALADIEAKEKEVQTVHLIPQPDENTVEFTLDEPQDLSLDREYLEAKGNFSFGEYLPFVRYFDISYDSSAYFSNFSVLSDESKTVEDGNALYESFNNKYKETFEACEDVDEKIAKHLFESKVLYISENADRVATFALQDKGKTFKEDDYKNRIWGSVYKVYDNSKLFFTENVDAVSYNAYSLGKYYTSDAVREFNYNFGGNEIKTTENGYLLGDIYRDENVRIYRIEEKGEQPHLLVYSLEEDRIIYKINLSEKLSKYPYRLIEQVIDNKYFVMTIETYSKTFLYDIEKNEFKYLASNIENPLISPDLKYVIGISTRRRDSLCAIDIESGDVAEFKLTKKEETGYYDSRRVFETINWIRKDKFMEAIS